jgi:hypothetical protein
MNRWFEPNESEEESLHGFAKTRLPGRRLLRRSSNLCILAVNDNAAERVSTATYLTVPLYQCLS